MENGREVELKLQIAAHELARLKKHPALRAMVDGRAVSKRLRSIYFDTPELELWRAGVTLRLRGLGRRRVQTAKLVDRDAAGALDRVEWEREVVDDRPVLADLPAPFAEGPLGGGELTSRLQPALETEFHRSMRTIRPPGGGAIEVAFDVGAIRAGDAALPISEIELELKDGRAAQLFDLALGLAELVPLRVEVRSKASRGFAALAGATYSSVKSRPLRLEPDWSVEAAFRAIAEACLAHLLVNQAAALDGGAAEGVHQMRVALRRLRAALSLFRMHVDSPETRTIGEDVSQLARTLGLARDADVFLDELLAPALAGRDGDERLEAFRQAAEALRRRRYEEMSAALGASGYTALALRLGAWIADARWRRPGDGAQAQELARPIAEIAPGLLDVRRRKMRKLGERLEELGVPELHRLRIQCKKLRYASEFLQSLYPEGGAEAYVESLTRLQDSLGFLNDAAAARSLAEAVVDAAPEARRADLQWAAGFVAGWRQRKARRDSRKVAERWREVRRRPKFWR